MGDINNMRNVVNSNNSVKSYVINKNIKEKQNKPKLRITGVKDLVTLIGPNAKKYKLNTNQRKFQLVSRVGLGIAGIAAAFSIANATINSNVNSIDTNNTQYSTETQTLDKDEVLSYAEDKLMTLIYKDNLSSLTSSFVEYSHDDKFNIDKLKINKKIKYSETSINNFSYTRYNNPENMYLNRKNHNEPEITALLDLMIDIHNNPNPSQEDLASLNDIALKLNLNNLVLTDNSHDSANIVNEAKRDSGYEIGD
ncbi:MAG: hypothetical protein HFJ57_07300 [Clostridia bacterium]|nr:hypothetical protein [Clostridia bacterium]